VTVRQQEGGRRRKKEKKETGEKNRETYITIHVFFYFFNASKILI